MRKKLCIFVTALIVVAALLIAALFFALQTHYAKNIVNALFSQDSTYQASVENVHYTPPLNFELEGLQFQVEQQAYYLPSVRVWLSTMPWKNGKLAIDSLIINGGNIELHSTLTRPLHSLSLQQLAFQHVDLIGKEWSARNVNVQIEQPKWVNQSQHLPYGKALIEIEQLYTQGQALDDILLDIDNKAENSTVYGASFQWQGASFTGQAEQYQSKWSLVNVTIKHLSLIEEALIEEPQIHERSERSTSAPSKLSSSLTELTRLLASFNFPVNHINSLDIIRSNLSIGDVQFENLAASIENIDLEKSIWDQPKGYLSFDADNARYHDVMLIAPTAKFTFSELGIQIEDFDADLNEGRILFSGLISPGQLALDSLTLSGVKWLENTKELGAQLWQSSQQLKQLSIQSLNIENSQFIQIEQAPFWQVSGLQVDGTNLTLVRQHQLGLWQGSIELSANTLSVDKTLVTQPIFSAHSEQDVLTIERAIFPLEHGYFRASAQWDKSKKSAPWSLDVEADSLPLKAILTHVAPHLPFDGLFDIQFEAKGLSGDYAMFAHSVSGEGVADIHRGRASLKQTPNEMLNDATTHEKIAQPFSLDNIAIVVDRGRIKIKSDVNEDNALIMGDLDLTKMAYATLLYTHQEPCQRLWFDLFTGKQYLTKQYLTKQCESAVSETKVDSKTKEMEPTETKAAQGLEVQVN